MDRPLDTAAKTFFIFSQMRSANTAIYSAWSYQYCLHIHVPILAKYKEKGKP
jgi:hypothetical protein